MWYKHGFSIQIRGFSFDGELLWKLLLSFMKFLIFLISLLVGGAIHYWTAQNNHLRHAEEVVFKEITKAVFSEEHLAEVEQPAPGVGLARVSFYEEKSKALILNYQLNDSQKGIFESLPLSASDWAVVIHNLDQRGIEEVAIQSMMSWDKGQELELSALDAGLSNAKRAVVGIHYRRISSERILPDYFTESAIPQTNLRGKIQLLPEVNEAVFPPSTTGAQNLLYGFLSLESEEAPVITASGQIKLPMLARWGDSILPSWPLAVAMAQVGASADEVRGSLGGDILVGTQGLVIPLDEFGRATFQINTADSPSELLPDLSRILAEDYQVKAPEGGMAMIFDRSKQGGKIDYSQIMKSIFSQKRLGEATNVPLILPWAGGLILVNIALFATLIACLSTGNRWIFFPLLGLGCLLLSVLVFDLSSFWLPVLPLLSAVLASLVLSPFYKKKPPRKVNVRRNTKKA